MRYARKILFTFICFFTISNVYAAEITLNSNETVNVDSNIDVTINISEDIEAWQFDLNYDSNVLQLISSDLESATRSVSTSNMHTRTYNLTFKALTNANTTISLSNVSGYDIDENKLNVTTNTKTINPIYRGWVTLNGNTYYYDENGNMLKGLQEIDGQNYLFGVNSGMLYKSGLATTPDGNTYYTNVEGVVQTGWQTIDSSRYYFNNNGVMQKGIVVIDNSKYLFGVNTGRLYTSGLATTPDGNTYYTNEEGIVQTGWQIIDLNIYHFNEDGKLLSYTAKINFEVYYYDNNGNLLKGIQEINGQNYLFGVNSGKLYVNGLATTPDGNTYYTNEEGVVQTGWQTIDSNRYYFDNNGVMQKGIVDIDSNKYLFGVNSGKLYTNGVAITPDGNAYYTNSQGVIQTGEIKINNQVLKIDDNGILLNGLYTIDNQKYYIDENNKAANGLNEINNNTYYFINGIMQTGPITIDNNIYYFSDDGILTKIQYIPVYYNQKDGRWANNYYGRWKLGPTGCLPTSMAMALSGILSTSILPSDVANYLYNYTNEYNKSFGGSSGLAIVYSANNYNVIAEGINSYAQMVEALANGKIIVGSVGNGKFARGYTHAIVLYNFDSFSTIAYDPNNSYNNGWIDILSVWNQQSHDIYDLNGGYAFYALSTSKYKINETGKILEGWVTLNGSTYYYDNDGNLLKGVQKIDGKNYLFGVNSGMLYKNGLATTPDGNTYYTNEEGIVQIGWQTINSNIYYFDNNGVMQKGIIKIDDKNYLLGLNSGMLYKNGLATTPDGNIYYTNEEGIVQTGWQTINSDVYFFDENGAMQKGIIKIDDKNYLLGVNSGRLYTGGFATTPDGNIYYTNEDGVVQTGWQIIDNATYYFDENGVMQKGWQTIDSNVYYFDEIGNMLRGIQVINGQNYLFGVNSGKLYTGGFATTPDGNIYYTNKKGIIQKGIVEIDGKKYLFGVNSGILYKGGFATTPDGNVYYTDSEGIIQTGDIEIEGRWYRFNDDGVLQNGWQTINGNKYYFNLDGSVVTGVAKITGTRYLFSSTGVLLKSNVKSYIDVSYSQGQIDWDTLWSSGEIDGAILRIGYGSNPNQLDKSFEENLKAVKRLNIPFTIYLYSYAENSTEAIWEADNLVNWINQYDVKILSGLPIYLDIERYGSSEDAIAKYTEVIPTFISRMSEYGLGSKVYTYAHIARAMSPEIRNYVEWIALYNSDNTYEYSWNGWQYTSEGRASGVSGNVDLSVFK